MIATQSLAPGRPALQSEPLGTSATQAVTADYDSWYRDYRWHVPANYNVAADVCDKHPADRLALILSGPSAADDRLVLWGEIHALANQFANLLAARQIQRGDRVAVLLPASVEYAAAVIGVLKTGAICVPMAALWSDDSLSYRLQDAGVKLLITDYHNSRRALGTASIQHLVDRDSIAHLSTRFTTVDTAADEPALIYFTSGSTGQPKGVIAPHRGLIGHNEFDTCQDLRAGEISYWMGDWAWGVYKILGPWRHGAVNLVHVSDQRYDPEGLLAALARHRVSNVFFNPTGLRLMMQSVPDAGTRFPQSFRVCCAANEPLGQKEATWFREQFGIDVLQNYGMTEAYPMVGNFQRMPIKHGSMGLPVPGWQIALLDDNEQPVARGEHGEICLLARSNPQFPLGYWNRPADSAVVFGGKWFHANDLAWQDADGYLWYVGRKDDVIKASGYRISPFEIEEVCCRHPAVAAAGVIAVADADRGATVKAFIVLAGSAHPGAALALDIKQYVKQHHSSFGYPKIVEFVDCLPESQSGKINRAMLRKRSALVEY